MKTVKQLASAIAILLVAVSARAQNWTTVSASNITDLNQNKLASGQLCFLGTDQNDSPISFSVGGGGQVLKRAFCSAVSSGAVTAFTVPNPANTQPAGVYYRVTVKDSANGLEVLRYAQVTFTGGTFNFDIYQPNIPGASLNPLIGNSVTGNLSVSGSLNVTGPLSTPRITNSSLTGPGNGNSVTLLNAQGPTAAITGTGADMTIYTYTLPGNTLGPGKCMMIKARIMHSVGTASAIFKMTIGATMLTSNNYANANNFNEDRTTLTICNNAAVQNSQYYEQEGLFNQSGSSAVIPNGNTNPSNISSVDFTSAQVIKFTVNVATTDQITPKFWIVEALQ